MEGIEDIIEILALCDEEIKNNDENVTATLDLQDLKALKRLWDLYNKEIEMKNLQTKLNTALTLDNMDLADIFKRTAEKLRESGKVELADYFLAQIGAVPSWRVDDYCNWINKNKVYEQIKALQAIDTKVPGDLMATVAYSNEVNFAIRELKKLIDED